MGQADGAVVGWVPLGERPVQVRVAVPVSFSVRAAKDGVAVRVEFGGVPLVVTARTRARALREAERQAAEALGRFLSVPVPGLEAAREAG